MRRRGYMMLLGIVALVAVINVVAWESVDFCDFYVRNIYPIWVNTYGRLTGLFSFSVGEWMIIAGLVLTVIAVIAVIAALAAVMFFCNRKVGSKLIRICKVYFSVYACIFTGVFVIMTLVCFIPYHCSSLEEKYGMLNRLSVEDTLIDDLLLKEYTIDELVQLRNFVVIKTNELAEKVERDNEGNILYPVNMEELAIECMQSLSDSYGQLSGYYPQPKQFAFSGFFSQQKMKGYFFPFSMEVNYNALMHEINRPATICHEYAHLKGFMYEEEANLIGFLACANSPDITFQYSGYLSILNYINNEYYDAIGRDLAVYASQVNISPLVKSENVFLEEKAWEEVEAKAVINTEVVDKVSDKLSETSMVLNGVEDGILSYTRVVGLLLKYYDGSVEVQETLYGTEYLVQTE